MFKILFFDKKAPKLSNALSLMHFGPLVGYKHGFEVGKIFWIFGNFPLRTLELTVELGLKFHICICNTTDIDINQSVMQITSKTCKLTGGRGRPGFSGQNLYFW